MTAWPDITDGSTAEEVTAVRVAMKLEGFSGYFDNPITHSRERWRHGVIADSVPRVTADNPNDWMQPINPDPRKFN